MKGMEFPKSISAVFLRSILPESVVSFSVSPGTKPGDNYLSDIFSIEVQSTDCQWTHFVIKCFPTLLSTRTRLIATNIFWNEFQTYKIFIPAMEGIVAPFEISLPFTKVIAGEAVDFKKLREEGYPTTEIMQSYEANYLLMENIQKALGFRGGPWRASGFNSAHVVLVIKQLAAIHSISWAYKQRHNLEHLGSAFRSLELVTCPEWKANLRDVIIPKSAVKIGQESDNTALVSGTVKFQSLVDQIVGICYEASSGRDEAELDDLHLIKPPKIDSEVPWRVVIHGDCWGNNILFRYDEATGHPIEVIFVDLQIMREGCPTIDLVYFIYSSTRLETRRANLEFWLELYYNECLRNCKLFQVNPLPGFSLPELKRRFHRSKVFAYFMAAVEEDENITELAEEMYQQGVI